jgi:hypothetical protein
MDGDILDGAPQFNGFPNIGEQQEPELSDDGESEMPQEQKAPVAPGAPTQKKPSSTNIEEVNILSSAIKMMNKYAQLIEADDPTNSKAARSVISVLAELLKSEHYDLEKEKDII